MSRLHVRVTDLTHFQCLIKNVAYQQQRFWVRGNGIVLSFVNQNLTRNRVAQKPREAKKGQQ